MNFDLNTSLREIKTSFESFQKERDRLDDFYVKETNMCNYKILSSAFKLVLVLSHGQAEVERGLSVSKFLMLTCTKFQLLLVN